MRPAWMDEIVAKLEETFYDSLRDTDIAKKTIEKYPDEPIEVLARDLAEGMDKSRCGDYARNISKKDVHLSNYAALCKEAFENAMARLLVEAKGGD